MFIAKVVGNVVATRKNDTLIGHKLMVIEKRSLKDKQALEELVAVDYVGAGIGEVVLVGSGSAVRVEQGHKDSVIDLAIIGIIDEVII